MSVNSWLSEKASFSSFVSRLGLIGVKEEKSKKRKKEEDSETPKKEKVIFIYFFQYFFFRGILFHKF